MIFKQKQSLLFTSTCDGQSRKAPNYWNDMNILLGVCMPKNNMGDMNQAQCVGYDASLQSKQSKLYCHELI
jgi:hypothetical protein